MSCFTYRAVKGMVYCFPERLKNGFPTSGGKLVFPSVSKKDVEVKSLHSGFEKFPNLVLLLYFV